MPNAALKGQQSQRKKEHRFWLWKTSIPGLKYGVWAS